MEKHFFSYTHKEDSDICITIHQVCLLMYALQATGGMKKISNLIFVLYMKKTTNFQTTLMIDPTGTNHGSVWDWQLLQPDKCIQNAQICLYIPTQINFFIRTFQIFIYILYQHCVGVIQGWEFAHSLIANGLGRSEEMSDCERCAQVAQRK